MRPLTFAAAIALGLVVQSASARPPVILPVPVAPAAWNQANGAQGSNDRAGATTGLNPAALTIPWSAPAIAEALPFGNRVYIPTAQGLRAVDKNTGIQAWLATGPAGTTPKVSPACDIDPATGRTVVFVLFGAASTTPSTTYAFRDDGAVATLLWQYANPNSPLSAQDALSAYRGRLFLSVAQAGGTARVIALDSRTGALLYNHAVNGFLRQKPAADPASGALFYITTFGIVRRLDAAGNVAWAQPLGGAATYSTGGAPAFDAALGRLYVVSATPSGLNEVTCLAAATGAILWQSTATGATAGVDVSCGGVAMGPSLLYVHVNPPVTNPALTVRALDKGTGALVWTTPTPVPPTSTGQRTVLTLAEYNRQLWGFHHHSPSGQGPSYCLDAATGAVLGQGYTTLGAWRSVVAGDDALYVGAYPSGSLTSIQRMK